MWRKRKPSADPEEEQILHELYKDMETVPLVMLNAADVRKRLDEKLPRGLRGREALTTENVGMFISACTVTWPKKNNKGVRFPFESCKLPLSALFVDFLGTGETELLRRDALERIWSYAKLNKLVNGAIVTCDNKLKKLFGVESLGVHDIQKSLEAHFLKTECQVYYEMKN